MAKKDPYVDLIAAAKAAALRAYAPYSRFCVGAAVRTASGRIFTGCNVENASFGATICAERVAISKAISEGEQDFMAVAIVSSAGKPTPPCGICRQVMAEFSEELPVVLSDEVGNVQVFPLSALFPRAKFPFEKDKG